MSRSFILVRIARQRRRGLTLMELVVVMVILIALAGILLPLFPSILTRAHTSSAATNMSELSKAVQAYYAQELTLPYNLDNIAPLIGQASPVNSNVNIVAVTGGTSTAFTAASPDIATGALAQADYNLLLAGGMNTVLQTTAPTAAAMGSWTPTYNPYSTTAIGASFLPQNPVSPTTGPPGASTALTVGSTVVYVNPYAVSRELGQPAPTATTTPVYLMFGVGDYSSLIGVTLQEAPIHFDDSPTGEPSVCYCRFGLIFETTATGVTTGTGSSVAYSDGWPTARFMGAVDLGDSTISSIPDHIQAYLQTK